MAAISHRRGGSPDYTWPGYVDALTTLLMVMIFLLSLLSVAQFTLSRRAQQPRQCDRAARQADRRPRQPAVDREEGNHEPAKGPRTAHPCSFARNAGERVRLNADLAAQRQSGRCAQDRARPAHRTPDLDDGRARQALDGAAGCRQGVGGQGRRPAEGDRTPSASNSHGSPPRSPPRTTRRASCSAI